MRKTQHCEGIRERTVGFWYCTGEFVAVENDSGNDRERRECGGERTGEFAVAKVEVYEAFVLRESVGYLTGDAGVAEEKVLEVGEVSNGGRDSADKVGIVVEREAEEEREVSNGGWDLNGLREVEVVETKMDDTVEPCVVVA
ncbi:unnamed protein product [Lathyrus oleraceus]